MTAAEHVATYEADETGVAARAHLAFEHGSTRLAVELHDPALAHRLIHQPDEQPTEAPA